MRTPRSISLLAARVVACSAAYVAIGACASTRAPAHEPAARSPGSADQLVEHAAPNVDVSGSWTTGTGAEPTVPAIVLPPACNYTVAAWIIRQRGDSIQAWNVLARPSQGIRRKEPEPQPEISPGTMSGLDVVIDDAQSHYRLRYDPASGHLRGTLNGRPFWAIRQRQGPRQRCTPIP